MKCLALLAAFCLCCAVSNAADNSIRVMTYNIHHAEGVDGALNLERIAKVIEAARPDIVCLQEVDRSCERTKGLDFPAELAKRLNMEAAFGPNLKIGDGDYGTAMLTRFDITSQENVRLPGPKDAEPRGCLKTVLDVGGRELQVFTVHFGLDEAERIEQGAAVGRLLGDRMTVLAGDFNETTEGKAMGSLLRRMQDTFAKNVGDTNTTIGQEANAKRIDFVLVSNDMNVLSSRVIAAPDANVASDHLPYVTDLALPAPPESAADRGVYDQEDDERVTEAVTGGE